MNNSATLPLRRGAALGLALLLLSAPVAGDSDYLDVKRRLKGHSFILIEDRGVQQLIFLGPGPPHPVVLPDSEQRQEALLELVDSGNADSIVQLAAALHDPSRRVRLTAIRLLGEIDSVDARLALEPMLADPDIGLRLEVVEAIADTSGAAPLLRLAGENEVQIVAGTAREYLAEQDRD